MREFFDVVDQTKEPPLAVDFRPAAPRETIEPFVVLAPDEMRRVLAQVRGAITRLVAVLLSGSGMRPM